MQLHNLRDAVVQRLNRCTADVLQHSDDYKLINEQDPDKREMLACKTDDVTGSAQATRIAIWANLKQTMQRGPFKQFVSLGMGLMCTSICRRRVGTQRLCVRAMVLGWGARGTYSSQYRRVLYSNEEPP